MNIQPAIKCLVWNTGMGAAVAAEAVEVDERGMNDKKGSVLVMILEILLDAVS